MQTIRPRAITAADAAVDPSAHESSYLAKVIRLIPAEIVAAYLAAYNALASAAGIPLQTVLWIVVAVLTILTPVWILYATTDPNKPRPTFQAGAATLSFMIWIFAIPESPLSTLPWYRPVYGFLLLILGTFLMPILEKVFVKSPQLISNQGA